jgi:hypothetical protein
MTLLLMLILTGDIEFGRHQVDFVHSVECESGWAQLTDTCTLQFPRRIGTETTALKDLVKPGDAVRVSLGYDGDNAEVFSGYVRQVNPIIPFAIMCEDLMWNLKQQTYTKAWQSTTVKEVLALIAPGVATKAIDATIGKFEFERLTGAKVLDELRSKYGLFSFVRDGRLQVGLQYDPEYARTHAFHFERNIISHQLEYWTKDNIRLNVEAISIGKDNTKTSVEVGDREGEKRTMHFYDLSQTELKAAAERELARLKYDGYRGDFTTFGRPHVRHGDIVELTDPTFNRGGKYWVDKVRTSFGMGGYRQTVTLGPAA